MNSMIVLLLSIAEILTSFQSYSVESRYCGILQLVRVIPAITDNIMQAKASSKLIEERMVKVLARTGPRENLLRQIHTEVNQSQPIPAGDAKLSLSEDMKEGGLGLLTLLCKQIKSSIETIAEKGPKYKELIRMENYYFLQKTLSARNLPMLNPFITDCKEEFNKVLEIHFYYR